MNKVNPPPHVTKSWSSYGFYIAYKIYSTYVVGSVIAKSIPLFYSKNQKINPYFRSIWLYNTTYCISVSYFGILYAFLPIHITMTGTK